MRGNPNLDIMLIDTALAGTCQNRVN